MSKRVSYPETQRVEPGTVLASAAGVLYVVTVISTFDDGYGSKAINLVHKSEWLAWKEQQANDLHDEIQRLKR